MLRNDENRYGAVAQTLHWLIAALIFGMFGLGWYMADLPLTPEEMQHKLEMYQLHKSLGVTIFTLVIVRLIWRWRNPAPPLPATLPGWERAAAHVVHGLLYLMLLVQPLIGFLQSNAANFPVVWWGMLPLPAVIGPNEALGETLVAVHEWGARVILLLLALHIGAALRHHFLIKDDILRRMLPARST